MKKFVLALLAVLALSTPSFAQAASPKLSWDYDTVEIPNVTGFTWTVDGSVQNTVLNPTTSVSGTVTTYTVSVPTPSLATHTYVVYACNPIGCTASDPFTIKPPAKSKNVQVR